MLIIVKKETLLTEFIENLCDKAEVGWGSFYFVPFFMQKDKDGTVYLHELSSSEVPADFKFLLKKRINERIL